MTITLEANIGALESQAESNIHGHLDDMESLADQVADIVQDTSYTHRKIIRFFDLGLRWVSAKVLLPDLEAFTELQTKPGVNHVALPADFQKNLRYCHSITHNRQVQIAGSLLQIYRQFSRLEQSGRVVMVAPHGNALYYQRVPAVSERLLINYYRYPDRLFSRFDKAYCLPAELVTELLVNYAAWKIFDRIEDGIETQKVNTTNYKGLFDAAMGELVALIGPEEREPVEAQDEMNWEAYL